MSVEDAINALLKLVPGAEIGTTAKPGSKDFDRARSLSFRRCSCGQQRAGWQQPEFLADLGNGRYLYIGYDARSNKISCGPKGFHSSLYAYESTCPSLIN